MRNVPSDRPSNSRSASARLHDISHVLSSRWGSGAASPAARPLLLVSIKLSRLWWLSPQSNNHLTTTSQQNFADIITLISTCRRLDFWQIKRSRWLTFHKINYTPLNTINSLNASKKHNRHYVNNTNKTHHISSHSIIMIQQINQLTWFDR